MATIQIVSLLGSLVFLFFVFELIRRKKLQEAYALLWFILGIGFIVISIFTGLLTTISKLIGITYPPATLFLALLVTVVLILIQLSTVISKQNNQIRKLAQKIALLEQQINKDNNEG